jgi:uncharacterized membrane protein YgaE (UPF0421/DUF939 family)
MEKFSMHARIASIVQEIPKSGIRDFFEIVQKLDSDDNIIEENELYDNYSDENNYLNDEDSYDIYAQELYQKKDLLIEMIEFIENTHFKSNKQHIEYLEKLKCSLANLESDIDRHNHLERELEKIYGPSHIKYKSLYDLAVEKRELEEQKLKEAEKSKRFYEMINSKEFRGKTN